MTTVEVVLYDLTTVFVYGGVSFTFPTQTFTLSK